VTPTASAAAPPSSAPTGVAAADMLPITALARPSIVSGTSDWTSAENSTFVTPTGTSAGANSATVPGSQPTMTAAAYSAAPTRKLATLRVPNG